VTGGNADDAFGVAFAVIAEQPTTWVAVAGIKVGAGDGETVERAADWGEQELRSSKIKDEMINNKNVFMRMEFPRSNDLAAIVPQLSLVDRKKSSRQYD
jgi:hypothetical protein